MIKALDHIVLVCPDIEIGTAIYSALLGRAPDWQAQAAGSAIAVFRLGNTALELMAPYGDDGVAPRLREIITDDGPGLKSLAFATDDIGDAHHRLTRRGLAPKDITSGESKHAVTGETRKWSRFRCDDTATAGIKTFLLEAETDMPVQATPEGGVSGLDHIVIDTPSPDRALALYGARLGLDLKLDRTAEEWKTRFLFFRTGGLTFEVIHRLGADYAANAPDKIWGLTWQVDDLTAAWERLKDAGFDVSDMRKGRKPGSSVFTVRDGTMNVPTLFIAHAAR